jgi:hypothetical protein
MTAPRLGPVCSWLPFCVCVCQALFHKRRQHHSHPWLCIPHRDKSAVALAGFVTGALSRFDELSSDKGQLGLLLRRFGIGRVVCDQLAYVSEVTRTVCACCRRFGRKTRTWHCTARFSPRWPRLLSVLCDPRRSYWFTYDIEVANLGNIKVQRLVQLRHPIFGGRSDL